ncbi:uncharacterized protein [Aegilops tauschii subsp. strangulata]|uniref:uncharacterized protein n=1 Tax=Aegilops tauschii subsp. strangulata TaxID=200361 RepID=UPI00098A2CEB|nr:uncharacterized protein LOC109749363 [Aegilops tauschii subsp. strangulata]
MFIMSFYSLRETLHHEIAKYKASFYWTGEGDKQKNYMVSWAGICKPRDQGGLGIMFSKRMNIALLTCRLWRIANGEGGLWLDIIRNKYLRGQPHAFCQWSGGSQVTVMAIHHSATPIPSHRDLHYDGVGLLDPVLVQQVDNGSPLRRPVLRVVLHSSVPNVSVQTALIDLGHLAFRRLFGPTELAEWQDLLDCIPLHPPEVDQPPDHISWRLDPSGWFPTKSVYQAIAPSPAPAVFTQVWENIFSL